jgi:hypothetical protein
MRFWRVMQTPSGVDEQRAWKHAQPMHPEHGSSGCALRPNWMHGKQNEIKPVYVRACVRACVRRENTREDEEQERWEGGAGTGLDIREAFAQSRLKVHVRLRVCVCVGWCVWRVWW